MFKEKYTMNKWINTFSTEEEYYAYINGDADHYPSISFIESTNSVYILDQEPEPEEYDYYITVLDQRTDNLVEEGGELYVGMDYWIELKAESGDDPTEPFDGEFVMTCQNSPDFYFDVERDDEGGVDGTLRFDGAEDGDTITISYVQNGETLASASYVASVSSGGDYRLVLSTCNPEGDVNNICETQGFCSDSDYYVILLNQGELVNHTDQLVTYYSIAYGENITPSLDGGGSCVWQCSSFDPSIEVVVCYDSNNNIIATLETSCE